MIGGNLVERGLIGPRVVGGTWSAATAWTIPAVTLGGNITATGKEIDAAILDACVAKGTWTSSGTWTLPAVTLGGALTINGQTFNAGAGSEMIETTGSLTGLDIVSSNASHGVGIRLFKNNASIDVNEVIGRITWLSYDGAGAADNQWGLFDAYFTNVGNGTEEMAFKWSGTTAGVNDNTAMTLTGAGALWTDASVDTLLYKVSGTQVVGARVVDARCDDVVDSTYGAEEAGVLDALRDAMISHGLISAA